MLGVDVFRRNGFLGNSCIYGDSKDTVFCLDGTRSYSTNVVIRPLIVVFERGAKAIFLRVLLVLSVKGEDFEKEVSRYKT